MNSGDVLNSELIHGTIQTMMETMEDGVDKTHRASGDGTKLTFDHWGG